MVSEHANIEYLISRHLLKQLLAKGLISEEEYKQIDAANRQTFDK